MGTALSGLRTTECQQRLKVNPGYPPSMQGHEERTPELSARSHGRANAEAGDELAPRIEPRLQQRERTGVWEQVTSRRRPAATSLFLLTDSVARYKGDAMGLGVILSGDADPVRARPLLTNSSADARHDEHRLQRQDRHSNSPPAPTMRSAASTTSPATTQACATRARPTGSWAASRHLRDRLPQALEQITRLLERTKPVTSASTAAGSTTTPAAQ